ncbi:hypothetical protein OKJ48_43360 [Streptomyces kunmingensis]|uniref:Tetrahydromethanopterin S-methyltransferase n=1 Tax=Streptomyces kunmingensis TaxID=68225 RepID=A0ABU6CQK8_9ACTN|nr:hypothetical protein [Streptomyces kunmingensis]MEB3967029.1 hypothetical protein [Streptomyces kunmingensis]
MNEDEIQRAVARGIRDYEKSRPKPKGIIDEASSAACGCIALFVAALVVMGIVVA